MRQVLVDPAGINGLFQPLPGVISEGKTSERGYPIVRGVLQRKDALNQNRRRYPATILEREATKYQTLVKERRALGELDHPDSSVISLQNVSHNILSMHWDGDDLVGDVEILCDRPDGVKGTPAGNILKSLFDAGIKVGISSRGVGSVREINEADGPAVEVLPDFELLGFDFVSNPSTHGAFLKPVAEGKMLSESKQVVTKNKYSTVHSLISEIICDAKGVCCCLIEGKQSGANHK